MNAEMPIKSDTVTGTAYTANGSADMAMQLHDLSMSKDPHRACVGRAGKMVLNALNDWLEQERERGSSTRTMMLDATISTAVNVLLNGMLAIVGPENLTACATPVFVTFASAFREAVKASDEMLNKQEAEQKSA